MARGRVRSPRIKESESPYSQAIRVSNLLFIAGQVALDESGSLVGRGDVAAQTHQVMKNIAALCEAAGARIDDVVKYTVYLTDVRDFATVREVRTQYMHGPDYPASTLIGDIALAAPEFLVEIEAIVSLE